jgi:phage terminase large subunit
LHLVDYYEARGHSAEHYCEWLNERRNHGTDWVPHDARVREWSIASYGTPSLTASQLLALQSRLRTDAVRCSRGLDCLRSYCAEWDENLRTFKRTPKHDWSSHAADAFRYLAMAWREPMQAEEEKPNPFVEMCKPKALNQCWQEYTDELVEAGADPEEWGVYLD